MSIKDVVKRARTLDEGQLLREGDPVLSGNMVTGVSLNLPIYGTCKPSKVCAENCYAQRNHISFRAAVNKQIKVMNSIKADPLAVAERVASEMRKHLKKGVTYLRWNGVGDLFAESIDCLVAVADLLPNVPVWVVTRIPEQAVAVPHRDNIFVHFSLDASSLDRYAKVLTLSPKNQNLFFSYTASKDEAAPPTELWDIPISVFFTDRYKSEPPRGYEDVSCALNNAPSTANACEGCRRCFSSRALEMKQEREVYVLSHEPPLRAEEQPLTLFGDDT